MKQKRFLIFLLLCLLLVTGCQRRTFEDIMINERSSQKYTQAELLDVMKIAFEKRKENSATDKDIYELEYVGDKNNAYYSDYLRDYEKLNFKDCILFFARCDSKDDPVVFHLSMIKTEKGWELKSIIGASAGIGLPENKVEWEQ